MTLNLIIRSGARLFLFVLLQVFLFNHIFFTGLQLVPFFYLLFILTLPFEVSASLLLLFAFLTGGLVDIFSDTGGVHTAAAVLTAYIRPYWQKAISPRDGYTAEMQPTIKHLGLPWFLKYTSLPIPVYYLVFYTLHEFHFTFFILLKTLAASVFLLLIMIISQYLIPGK
ncbi:MAG: hypothetical protein CSB06_02115 [Bacteroidia bacterium]|nr:MAG: hypothetical protein CSB06_02115 [Bacteroidia bacterium]